MRIIFVRHGHPDYEKDCLTEQGRMHATAVAHRLENEKISMIFSSSCGRAVQTAEYIASRHGSAVHRLDFMREIGWGAVGAEPIEHDGQPWKVVDSMVERAQSVFAKNWESKEPFSENKVVGEVRRVARAFDEWLLSFGYEREGDFYRVRSGACHDTVVMASHAGSSSAVLSHLFNLPFPFVCASVRPDFTAVSIIELSGEEGTLIASRAEILNDSRHIKEFNVDSIFGR